MKLEDLNVYNLSLELGEEVWNLVTTWDYFGKDTIGKQLVKAADSVVGTYQKYMAGFIIKKTNNFAIFPEVLCSKQKHG